MFFISLTIYSLTDVHDYNYVILHYEVFTQQSQIKFNSNRLILSIVKFILLLFLRYAHDLFT